MYAFLHGLTLGFVVAAPVGPVGVLCIRRTLVDGRLLGLLSGLGAALADAVCGWLAAVGLTALSALLSAHAQVFQLAGGAALVVIGCRIALASPVKPPRLRGPAARLAALTSTFVLTATNPVTLLAFLSAFAGLNLVDSAASRWDTAGLVSGIFCGSAAWWCLLCAGAQGLRLRLGTQMLNRLNRAAGAMIALFGALGVAAGWIEC